MSLKRYYERQAATSRRLAEQAITAEQARRLLAAANDYEQRARELYEQKWLASGSLRMADDPQAGPTNPGRR